MAGIYRHLFHRSGLAAGRQTYASTTAAAPLDAVQSGYFGEPCIRVDENDQPLGMVTKEACHRQPILHRAFSVFIFNGRAEMLLQRRAVTKITFPNVWTNACCSHPHHVPDEMIDSGPELDGLGVRRAAARKLAHELGLYDVDVERMHVMGRFIYAAESLGGAGWWEHELDYAIVLPDFDDRPTPNPEEVSECRYIDRPQLQHMLADAKDGPGFSPWFQLFAQFRWLDAWWSNLDRLDRLRDPATIHRLNELKLPK